MTDTPQTRESLNLRIDAQIKDAYETEIYRKYGRLEPYAGTELERELRVLIGQGELSQLVDKVHEVARSVGEQSSENKKSTPNRSGTSEVVGYRIHSAVRAGLKEEAQDAADVTYASELVESVMWAYACGRQSETKAIDRLSRIEAFVQTQTSDKDAKTRRTDSIIDAVTPSGFTLETFDRAVDEEVVGIDSGDYARAEYLPRVLEKAGYTYHPEQPNLFKPIEKIDTSEQDRRDKLPLLRDDEDKMIIIAKDAIEAANSAGTDTLVYTPADGVAALGSGASQSWVQGNFDQIASYHDAMEYDAAEGNLEIDTPSKDMSIAARHKRNK